jgi:hypothetical protein
MNVRSVWRRRRWASVLVMSALMELGCASHGTRCSGPLRPINPASTIAPVKATPAAAGRP